MYIKLSFIKEIGTIMTIYNNYYFNFVVTHILLRGIYAVSQLLKSGTVISKLLSNFLSSSN